MAIDVGMNYKHIDFHKGTHGYPITNADDMVKPCPLMPDGEWHYAIIKISNDGGTINRTTYNPSDRYIYVQASQSVGYCRAHDDYAFGECRMSMYLSTRGWTGTMNFQGGGNQENGWAIFRATTAAENKVVMQEYRMYGTNTDVLVPNDGDVVYMCVYAYVYPLTAFKSFCDKHFEMGDD